MLPLLEPLRSWASSRGGNRPNEASNRKYSLPISEQPLPSVVSFKQDGLSSGVDSEKDWEGQGDVPGLAGMFAPDPTEKFNLWEGFTNSPRRPLQEIQLPTPAQPDIQLYGAVYQKLDLVGEGRFGRVFRARNIETGDFVALKVYKDDVEGRQAQQRELKALRDIRAHDGGQESHLLHFVDAFVQDGTECVILDYWNLDLRRLLKREPNARLPLADVRDIGRQLFRALDRLHDLQLVHLDGSLSSQTGQYPGFRRPSHSPGRLRLVHPRRQPPRLPGNRAPTLPTPRGHFRRPHRTPSGRVERGGVPVRAGHRT